MVNLGTFLAALWFAACRKPFAKYHVLAHLWRIDWPLMRQLLVDRRADLVLVPDGIWPVLRRGAADGTDRHHGACRAPDRAAGHGHPVHGPVRHRHGRDGAGRPRRRPQRADGVRRAGLVAALLGHRASRRADARRHPRPVRIAALFQRRAHRATVELTATLLLVGATFFIADGLQTIVAGALRGIKDTRMPLLFAAIGYWLIGFSTRLGARVPRTSRRGRRLDRTVDRNFGLCRASDLALPAR